MDSQNIHPSAIGKIFEAKGYKLHDEKDRVNVFGIRTADLTPNIFNDFVCLVWNDTTRGWLVEAFEATTDPGAYWLTHPMNVDGTAILVPGQYPDSHKIGLHKGLPALVQIAPVKVFRDANKDAVFDLGPETIESGLFGINIHRANATQRSTVVEKWSAGCQVLAAPGDMDRLMAMCKSRISHYGDVFTYTLIEEKDFAIL